MQIKIILLTLCAFLLIVHPALAQEDIPWPPDTDTLFTDAVEIVDSTDVMHFSGYSIDAIRLCTAPYSPGRYDSITSLFTTDSPIFVLDSEQGAIYVYEGHESNRTPWPLLREKNAIEPYCRRSDGTLIFHEFVTFSSGLQPKPHDETAWVFNPSSGELWQPDLICGVLPDLPGEGEWVIVPNEPEASEYRLCFTETGELTAPIPELAGQWRDLDSIATSPDKTRVLLSVGECGGPYYGYEVATQKFIWIFNFSGRDGFLGSRCYIAQWIDDTRFLMYLDSMGEQAYSFLIYGDLTQAESMQTLISGQRFRPQLFDHPPRYEVMSDPLDLFRQFSRDCRLYVYDLNIQYLETHSLGELCLPNLIIPEQPHIRVFHVVHEDFTLPATLAYYNLQTRIRANLYTGEIEHVFSASPTGRYIVMLMDENGHIDKIPEVDWAQWTEMENPQVAVYDTEADTIIYSFDAEGLPTNSYLIYEIEVHWLSGDYFLMIARDAAGGGGISPGRQYLRFVWIDEHRHLSVDNVPDFQLSPDGEHLLYLSTFPLDKPFQEGWTRGVYLLNLATNEKTMIMPETPFYTAQLHWQSDNIINITVIPYYEGDDYAFNPYAIRYTLRLNQGDP